MREIKGRSLGHQSFLLIHSMFFLHVPHYLNACYRSTTGNILQFLLLTAFKNMDSKHLLDNWSFHKNGWDQVLNSIGCETGIVTSSFH